MTDLAVSKWMRVVQFREAGTQADRLAPMAPKGIEVWARCEENDVGWKE
jgi:hypothetical protein